jgi:hypothetical protein
MRSFKLKNLYPLWSRKLVQKAGRMYSILSELQIGDNPPPQLWNLGARRIAIVGNHLFANLFRRFQYLPRAGREQARAQVIQMEETWLEIERIMPNRWKPQISERQRDCVQILRHLDKLMTDLELMPYPNPLSYI